jgi:formamidopyrimidine-DNA glycosylase
MQESVCDIEAETIDAALQPGIQHCQRRFARAGGIDPRRAAGRVSLTRYEALAAAVRSVLAESIATGGTTLRDYVNGNGRPGEFALRLNVYDREGEPCTRCGSAVRQARLGQRSTFFCVVCQR